MNNIDSERYEEALKTVVSVHIEHLMSFCLLPELNKEEIDKLALKLITDVKFDAEFNGHLQDIIRFHHTKFNVKK